MRSEQESTVSSVTAFRKTAAIVVAYHPHISRISALLKSVQQQTACCFLVNNGSTQDLLPQLSAHGVEIHRVEMLDMGGNRGLGAAQNAGIAAARLAGATHALILDQDSIPAPDMVEQLMQALSAFPDAAAAGPRYMDPRTQSRSPFVRLRGLRMERCVCEKNDSILPVDFLISSGCLIPMTVLEQVGGMRDSLFIDYVDVEWGLRARRQGFQCYGVCAARMQHTLGDRRIELFGRAIAEHNPQRHYYLVRNALLLYRESWIPLNWKLADAWGLLLKYGFYTVFSKPRFEHFRMMNLGILHGLQGRSGKLNES
jgi:rhamnosyltransferase